MKKNGQRSDTRIVANEMRGMSVQTERLAVAVVVGFEVFLHEIQGSLSPASEPGIHDRYGTITLKDGVPACMHPEKVGFPRHE